MIKILPALDKDQPRKITTPNTMKSTSRRPKFSHHAVQNLVINKQRKTIDTSCVVITYVTKVMDDYSACFAQRLYHVAAFY